MQYRVVKDSFEYEKDPSMDPYNGQFAPRPSNTAHEFRAIKKGEVLEIFGTDFFGTGVPRKILITSPTGRTFINEWDGVFIDPLSQPTRIEKNTLQGSRTWIFIIIAAAALAWYLFKR